MKLLFVDPSKSFQRIVASIFSEAGIEISFAESFAEAEQLTTTQEWGFVCTSLHLTDGNGLALCRHLREQPKHQHTPVILFTSDTSESLIQEAARAGATEVFLKANIGELINFIGRFTVRAKKIEGRVLYVEDSAAQALVVQEQLATLGLSIEWCGSGEDAWGAFQKREYDLVLTDIVLSGAMSGATLVSRIRSLADARGDTPIIAITAFDQLARRIELFHLGVSDYVAKPILEEELTSRVRNHIVRRRAEQAVKVEEKRRYDDTLLHLSRTLNTGSSDLAATLKEICRRTGEALNVSRASIWLASPDQVTLTCRAFHDKNKPDAELRASIANTLYPAYFEALLQERIVSVPDAQSHPHTWELAETYLIPNDIRGMLDIPIGPANQRVGVLCHEMVGAPRQWTHEEENFAAAVGDLVALAVESHQRWLADQQLRLAGLVFEAAAEAILICDRDSRIVTINDAFTAITGYRPEEVIGKTPAIFKSGRHDAAFYTHMWSMIATEGKWHGEIWDRRKSGEEYPKRLSITRVLDATGAISHYIGVFSDISQEKTNEEQLRFLAYNDVLTELPNRVFAETTLSSVIDAAASDGRPAAILCFDIDRFKKINSSFGHGSGDALLREAARRLQGALCRNAHLARWSGASFIAVLAGPGDAELAVTTAQRCIDAFHAPFQAGESELNVTLSIGIAIYPQHGHSPADLIKNAMTALGHAKDGGGNRYVFFTADMERRTMERLILESRLRHAIAERQFVVHYQPKIDAVTMAIVGAEALVRWQDPVEGLIPPGRFLPLAEDTGQIYPINDWVLHEACRQTAVWHRESKLSLPVSVNLPAGAFSRSDVVEEVRRILAETQLPPQLLELELTESAMIDDPQHVIAVFTELKALGVHLSIDDFGTGYSSLAYLRRFPVDILKIDRSFVANIGSSDDELVIVSSIIGLAKSLRLKTIAEGIERDAQAEVLRGLGCDQFQGYLFGRPVAADAFLQHALPRMKEVTPP